MFWVVFFYSATVLVSADTSHLRHLSSGSRKAAVLLGTHRARTKTEEPVSQTG